MTLPKNAAKGGQKNGDKLVKSEEMTPGTMPRPRTIFKIGKTGYKENDFGDGVITSKKNLDAAPYANNNNTEEACYAVMTQPEEEQLPQPELRGQANNSHNRHLVKSNKVSL